MSQNGFRALVPVPGKSQPPPIPPRSRKLAPKRPHVASACFQCRKSKARCSGSKPRCTRCGLRGLECEYDDSIAALNLLEMRQKYKDLLKEKDALQSLLSYIGSQPEAEAQTMLQRLRAVKDPQKMVNLVCQGDPLLQQRMTNVLGDQCTNVRELEEAALRESTIKLPARPWTILVGDGIVSHLISAFMAHDQPLLFSFIDRERFIEDMRGSCPENSKYCSRLLVNAICCLRSHNSPVAKSYNRIKGTNLRDYFMNETKRLLNLENGKTSLPTVQSLAIMFMCCAVIGEDRAGRIFRYMAYDMLKRLHLIRAQKQNSPLDYEGQKWPIAASRASWGLYCFESVISFAYAQRSLVARPTCPRTFLIQRSSRWCDGEHDSSLILDAMCDLSIIHNEFMAYRTSGNCRVGSQGDLIYRSQCLARIRHWRLGLTENLHVQRNTSKEVHMLRLYEDQVIINSVKYLNGATCLHGTDLAVKDISISCCVRSLESLEYSTQGYEAGLYSCFVIFPLYNTAITLLHIYDSEASKDVFGHLCHHLALRARDFPFTAFLLQGIKLLAQRLGIKIPDQARPYFKSLGLSKDDLQDVPITFVIPDHEQIVKELTDQQEASESSGVQLGALISKWSMNSKD